MSWFSKYVFDPIKSALARQASSQNPVSSAAGKAGLAAMQNIATVTSASVNEAFAHRSAVGLASPIIGALEDGLKSVVDAAVTASVGEVPIVGAVLAPEAVIIANTSLTFLEQHATTYLAGLLHHAKIQVSGAPADPTQPQG